MSQESVLRVGVDSRPAVEGARNAERALDSLGNKARRTETQLDQLQGAFNQFRNALGALAIFETIRQYASLSDEVTNLQNRLRLVTNTTQEATQVYGALLAVSNETRTSVADNAALFGRLATATRSMGLSYQEQIDLTRQLNQAMVISGASASEGAAGLLQLSQGLASGVLRGDELNSVLENVPRVARVIADGMGVPVGALRQLGHDGQISAQQVVDAFRRASPQLQAEFARMQPTIAGAFTVMKNSLLEFVRGLNESTGIATGFARVILFLSQHFDIIAGAIAGVALALLGSLVPALWAAAAAFLATPLGWITVGLTALGALFGWFAQQSVTAMGRTATGWEWIKAAALTFWQFIQPVLHWFIGVWDTVSQAVGDFVSRFTGHTTAVGLIAKTVVNFIINAYITAFRIIGATWNHFPDIMRGYFAMVVNQGATAVEQLVNSWQQGFRSIAGMLNIVAPELGARLNGALDSVTLHLPRLDEGGIRSYATEVGGIVRDQMNRDTVGGAFSAIAANVHHDNGAGAVTGGYGGTPTPTPAAAGDGADAARQRQSQETAEEMIARFRRVQVAGIAVAGTYYDVAEAQTEMNRMHEEYIRRFPDRQATWDREEAAMRTLVQSRLDAEHAQEIANNVLRAAIQPSRDYATAVEQINRLLALQRLSADDAATAMRNARIEYLRTQTDVQSGLELGNLEALNEHLNETARVAQAVQNVWRQTVGVSDDLRAQTIALGEAMQRDTEHAAFFADQLREVQQRQLELSVQMGDASWADAMLLGISRVMNGYHGMMSGVSNSFGQFFNSLTDGFARAVGHSIMYADNLGEALKEVARSAIAELISALVKLGIQWVLQHTLGQALATASTAASVAQAATVAAAWSPAAVAASIASFGAADVAGMAGMTAAYALGKVLSMAGGKKDGGYISGPGGPREDKIPYWLSNGEMVINAAATSKNRALLEAINRGTYTGGSSGYAGGGFVGGGGGSGTSNVFDFRNANFGNNNPDEIEARFRRVMDEHYRPQLLAEADRNTQLRLSQATRQRLNGGRAGG